MTAKKKAPAKKAAPAAAKAVATRTTNLPVNPTELLKKQLADANQRVGQSEAKRVKIGLTGFTAPDGSTGNTLEVVVVDYTLVHSYYNSAYDPDRIVPPVCYANNRIFNELAPVPDAPEPQSDSCGICPMNRFESAPNGKAKACRNSRLLAILPLDALDSAPLWTFSVAPTSTKIWDGYVRDLMKMNLTPMFAATKIGFDVFKTWAKPNFNAMAPLNADEVSKVMTRLEEARVLIDAIPDFDRDS